MSTDRFLTPNICNWCQGCGNFGIWTAFKMAAEKEGWTDGNTAIVAGIGCHGHIINFTKLSAFEGLHGRALPVASGIKLANHNLNVIVFTGDGDGLSEGGNHFVHTARRNQDITVILHDNGDYGLTTGQSSPRSPKGYISKSTPEGKIEEPINPLLLALSSGATFVARTYSGDINMTVDIITKASKHKGFALVDVLQPCVTYNKEYTHQFFQQNTYQIGTDHDKTNLISAISKSLEWDDKKIPVGIFYEVSKPTYEQQVPFLQDNVLVSEEPKKRNIGKLVQKFCL